MKVFHFDPINGVRGKFIRNSVVVTATAGGEELKCSFPVDATSTWSACSAAEQRDGNPFVSDIPVCFCLGPVTGRTSGWKWIAYIPQEVAV